MYSYVFFAPARTILPLMAESLQARSLLAPSRKNNAPLLRKNPDNEIAD